MNSYWNRIEVYFLRWIFCSTENSKVVVFDITAERSEPVVSYAHPKGGSVRDMLIDRNVVIFGLKIGSLSDVSSYIVRQRVSEDREA